MDINTLTEIALERHQLGDSGRATALSRMAVTNQPGEARSWYLLGLEARKDGDLPLAARYLSRSQRLVPMSAKACLDLARVLSKIGNYAAVERALRLLAVIDPANPDPWYWLSKAREGAGAPLVTAAALRRCLISDPSRHDVREALLRSVAAQVRQAPENLDDRPTRRGDRPGGGRADGGRISVVTCSIDNQKFRCLKENFSAILDGSDYELISIHDAQSLCEGYNRGFRRSTGDIVIFCHDDIEILSTDFETRVRAHLDQFDVIGVAGTTRMAGGGWFHSGSRHQRGVVPHRIPGRAGYDVAVYGADGVTCAQMQTLDGLFLAARRPVVEAIGFDEATFDGFDLYDMDFTYSAWRAGFRLAVCNDLCIVHASRGRFGEAWRVQASRFMDKHRAVLPDLPIGDNSVGVTRLETRAQVRAFVAALLTLNQGGTAVL